MILDFASEHKFDHLAGGLFIAGVEKLARCRSKNLGWGCRGGIGAIGNDLRVESSQLRSGLQFVRNEWGCVSALRFDWEAGQELSRLGKLPGLNEIFGPADLPGAQIFLRTFFLQAFGARESVLLIFQNALINWRALRERNPGGVRKIGENLRRVRSDGN